MLWHGLTVKRHFIEDTLPKRPYLEDIPHRIRLALENPEEREQQPGGEWKHWVFVPETEHHLCVVIAVDGETIITAHRDRARARRMKRE